MTENQAPSRRRRRQGSRRAVFPIDHIQVVAPPEVASESGGRQIRSEATQNPANNTKVEQSTTIHGVPRDNHNKDVGNIKNGLLACSDSSDDEMTGSSRLKSRVRVNYEQKQKKNPEPWWITADSEHLEELVMSRLNDIVTHAEEKDEDQYVMDFLDRKIGLVEEEDVMQRLLHAIQGAEDIDYVKSCPSSIIENEMNNEIRSDWNINTKKSRTSTIWEGKMIPSLLSSRDGDIDGVGTCCLEKNSSLKASSKVTMIEEIKLKKIQYTLPKWIPTCSGTYTDDQLLFTPEDFHFCVIEPVTNQIPQLSRCNRSSWMVEISDYDQASYLLEAYGIEANVKYFDALKIHTEGYIRKRIASINLKWLLEDDDSLELEVALNIHRGPIGIKFSKYTFVVRATDNNGASQTEPQEPVGLWIKGVLQNKELSRSLGGNEACRNGCAILSVDGVHVCDALELKKILLQAKADESRESITIRMCLSKYAKLDQVPKQVMQSIRRRDGKPYNPDLYKSFKEETSPSLTRPELSRVGNQISPLLSSTTMTNVSSRMSNNSNGASEDQKVNVRGVDKLNKRGGDCDDELKTVKDSNEELDFPTMDDVRDRLVDSDDDEEGKNINKAKAIRIHVQQYANFEKKLQPIVHLDYKDTEIHEKSILSSMWKQHKVLFGNTCDDSCDCISRIPELVANVIRDDTLKKKKRGIETEQELEGRICGISLYFVPKVLPLLRKEYPTETPTQLIKRLIYMWSLHQSRRMYNGRFGVRCSESCACNELFDDIFQKGSMENVKNTNVPLPKITTKGQPNESINHITPSDMAIGQNLKRKTSICSLKEPESPQQQKKQKMQSMSVNSISNPTQEHKTFISTMTNRTFEVVLDASKPLGGYFQTERGQNSRSKVFILSIYANGQLAMDKRIKIGAQVVAVMVANHRKLVLNHGFFQSCYTNANRKRQKLCVVLDSSFKAGHASAVLDDNWNSRGSWTGISNNHLGWAGGANCVPKFDRRKVDPRNSVGSSGWAGGGNYANWRKPSGENIPKSSYANERRPADSGVPNMPSSSKMYEQRKLRGPLSRDWRHNQKESPAQFPRVTHHGSDINILRDTIQNKSCGNLIDLLENGSFTMNKNILNAALREQYRCIGEELVRMRHSSHTDLIRKENDLEAKNKILKLYINCSYLIDRAISLRYWTVISFEVKHLMLNNKLSTDDGLIGGTVRSQYPVIDMGSLPLRKRANYISYDVNDSGDDQDSFHGAMHNNYKISLDQRQMVIDIFQDSRYGSSIRTKLGSFTFELNEIEGKCKSIST